MASNSTSSCPTPFLLRTNFPVKGGDVNARFCADILPGTSCCLPCPKQNFFYPDSFQALIHSTTYVNLAGVVCCCFLLLSFLVLPVDITRRHYLSVCLTIAVLLMQISFVIPLGSSGGQCIDAITAHDIYSSLSCALSGAFLLGGGWCSVMWVFLRTLSLHLQICWQMVPGRKFFLTAQAVGWTIPVVFLAVALSITGVSFRFGESCHINSKDGVETFWGPMLAVAAASVVTQSITFGYVAQVYLRSLFEEKPSTMQQTTNSQLPYTNSIRTVTAFQALRRIRRVISLQWRGILVVIIILADVIYFSTVFLQFDGTTQETPDNKLHAAEWMECMLFNGGEKIKCFKQAKKLVVDEGTAFSVLFLLSFNGFWALILLGRMDIYSAWFDLIKGLFTPKKSPDEFISYNAHRVSQPGNSEYEMLESKKRSTASTMDMSIMKPEPILTIPQNLSALREYNPSTFSAELRGRTTSGLTSPRPFSLYADKETAISRSPPTSPFSPYHDSPDSYLGSNAPFAPYADSPRVSPVRSSPKYPEDVRIGLAK